MLGLPGYEADEYRKHQVHSASPDKNLRVFASIHTDGDGNKTLVVAPLRASMENLLDQLDGKSSDGIQLRGVTRFSPGDALLNLKVLKIPTEQLGEGPQANIAKIIEDLSLRVSEGKESLNVEMLLNTKKEEQAEQLRQMAQGLVAMVDFAKSADPDDADLRKFAEFAKDMKASRDGTEVKVGIHVPTKEIVRLIEEELND